MSIMKPCSKCRNPRDRKGRYCLSCHNAYMREWRKTHLLTPEQKKKDICRSYTHVLINRGKILRQPCEICGESAQVHHPDYNNPRLVKWLCRSHHMALHKKLENEKYNWVYQSQTKY